MDVENPVASCESDDLLDDSYLISKQRFGGLITANMESVMKNNNPFYVFCVNQMTTAKTEKEYNEIQKKLHDLSIWKNNIQLQRWLENTWLCEHKVGSLDVQ